MGADADVEGMVKLTEEEQKICDQYGARDGDGFVHCHECPLVVDLRDRVCKANATDEDMENYT